MLESILFLAGLLFGSNIMQSAYAVFSCYAGTTNNISSTNFYPSSCPNDSTHCFVIFVFIILILINQ